MRSIMKSRQTLAKGAEAISRHRVRSGAVPALTNQAHKSLGQECHRGRERIGGGKMTTKRVRVRSLAQMHFRETCWVRRGGEKRGLLVLYETSGLLSAWALGGVCVRERESDSPICRLGRVVMTTASGSRTLTLLLISQPALTLTPMVSTCRVGTHSPDPFGVKGRQRTHLMIPRGSDIS
jgi:hypothetical protein